MRCCAINRQNLYKNKVTGNYGSKLLVEQKDGSAKYLQKFRMENFNFEKYKSNILLCLKDKALCCAQSLIYFYKIIIN